MLRYLLYSFLLVFFFTIKSIGSEGEIRLSLEEAIRIALKNNHEIKALMNSVLAEGSDVGISRSSLLPKINLEERFVRTNNPTDVFSIKLNQERFSMSDFEIPNLNNPDPISDFQTTFSVEQPILAIKELLTLKSSNKNFQAAGEDLNRKKEVVAFGVIHSYITVRIAKEFVGVAERTIDDAKENLRIADSRYKKGLGLFSDTLRASTSVTEAEQQLVSAIKNLKVAKRALGVILGMTESVDVDEQPIDIPLADIDYYREESLSRKDIRSLESRYEGAKLNVKSYESGYIPTVGVGGTYQLNDQNAPFGAEGSSWFVMAFLRWEIFNGGKREYERAKAKHKAAEVKEQLDGLKNAVSFQVFESHLAVEEAQKNVELAESSLRTAEEGTRLVKLRYQNSLSPFVDLLNAQVNLDRTRANLVAKRNEYKLAIATLSFESGTILEDLGIEE
jgi:outer membrane protein TolC